VAELHLHAVGNRLAQKDGNGNGTNIYDAIYRLADVLTL
jgi:hypothetical protein